MASFLPRTAPRAFQSFRAAAPRPTRFLPKPAAPLFRHFLATPAGERPRLLLGSTGEFLQIMDGRGLADVYEAPNFKAKTTQGDIDFHEFLADKWGILFSHPADFTPVCTTELGAFAKLKDEFEKRGVKMIGLVKHWHCPTLLDKSLMGVECQ